MYDRPGLLPLWRGFRGLPPITYYYLEEDRGGGECQVGVRPGVVFLAPDCEAFSTGPGCCAGTEAFVQCHGNMEGGTSYGTIHCLP